MHDLNRRIAKLEAQVIDLQTQIDKLFYAIKKCTQVTSTGTNEPDPLPPSGGGEGEEPRP